jgi:hypothetical protein
MDLGKDETKANTHSKVNEITLADLDLIEHNILTSAYSF